MQTRKQCSRGLASRFPRIVPAHIRSSRELHPRLENPLNEIRDSLMPAFVRSGLVCVGGRQYNDTRRADLQKETTPEGRRNVKKDALIAHNLKLCISHVVAMLNTVHARVDGNLDASLAGGMDCDLF